MTPNLILRDPDEIITGRRRDRADTEWHSLLGRAKSKPGRWWEVNPAYDTPGAARTAAYDINVGRNAGLPDGVWEATSRSRVTADGATIGVLFIKFVSR